MDRPEMVVGEHDVTICERHDVDTVDRGEMAVEREREPDRERKRARESERERERAEESERQRETARKSESEREAIIGNERAVCTSTSIGSRPKNRAINPTVFPTVGRRGPGVLQNMRS